MTEIAFYHLQRSNLEGVLPKLLEKTLGAGKRAVVMTGSPERARTLSVHLWSYDPDSWMPHGAPGDGFEANQPVWVTPEDENPNGAAFLFLTDGAASDRMGTFERCFELFDGGNDEAVATARSRWAAYKDAGHTLTYWQQSGQGQWEKK